MTNVRLVLKRYAIRALVCLSIFELFATPFDCGSYFKTFEDYGLAGFLSLPSVLIFQIGYSLLVVALLVGVIRAGSWSRFRALACLFGLSVAGYCLSLWAIHSASRAGEFGAGAAGSFALFGFLPSAGFIYFVAPVLFFTQSGSERLRPD